jgi:multisubunit Na+/H+ antiporter MnhB subunit
MLFTLLLLTAVVAAARGLWSPCGLSMLSSLNPVSEAGRGHRFPVTAAWYVAGAAIGGAVLGAACAGGAALVGRADPAATTVWTAALIAAVVAVVSDSRVAGWSLPEHPRQVDERWLRTYRRWIYAGGYGVQIGTGFATYIMTAAVYLVAGLAALTGDPGQALAAGVVFGAVRGLAIVVAGRARSAEALRDLLARVDAWAAASLALACAVEVSVAAVAAWSLAGPAPALAVTLAGAAAVALGSRRSAPVH